MAGVKYRVAVVVHCGSPIFISRGATSPDSNSKPIRNQIGSPGVKVWGGGGVDRVETSLVDPQLKLF
jgi:hypothetical protein